MASTRGTKVDARSDYNIQMVIEIRKVVSVADLL